MLRQVLGLATALFLCVGVVLAADEKNSNNAKNAKNDKHAKATITKVDAKNGTITVRMKDKEGKEVERTFKLTGDLRMLDSTGKFVVIDFFRSGDQVLVIEEEGRLKELRKHKDKGTEKSAEKKPAEKKPAEKKPAEKNSSEKK